MLSLGQSHIQTGKAPRLSWKGKYYSARGAEIYVESHGSGDPLICLHNFSANARFRFQALLPTLSQVHTCFLVDLRGHGRSTNHLKTWNHALIAEDVISLAEQITAGPVRFLAASSGGMAMLRVARERPDLVRAMVLDSSTYLIPEEVRHLYKPYDQLKPKLKKYYEEANEIYGPEYGKILAEIFHGFRLPSCDINIPIEYLKEIQSPTLLIAGDQDIFFPLYIHEAMHEAIQNSELYVSESAGHIVMEEYPELVAKLAIDFFERIDTVRIDNAKR